jgi:hypothetical protein
LAKEILKLQQLLELERGKLLYVDHEIQQSQEASDKSFDELPIPKKT